MKNLYLWLVAWGCLFTCLSFFSCEGRRTDDAFLKADSLNREAYEWRYKNLDVSEKAAEEALALGESYPSLKAEALNNLAFCSFIRMDFERADSLLNEDLDS